MLVAQWRETGHLPGGACGYVHSGSPERRRSCRFPKRDHFLRLGLWTKESWRQKGIVCRNGNSPITITKSPESLQGYGYRNYISPHLHKHASQHLTRQHDARLKPSKELHDVPNMIRTAIFMKRNSKSYKHSIPFLFCRPLNTHIHPPRIFHLIMLSCIATPRLIFIIQAMVLHSKYLL